MTTDPAEPTLRVADHVTSEVIDGEAVIVDLAVGHYHAATGTAATLWALLTAGTDATQLMRRTRERHADAPVDAGTQIQAFLEELRTRGLIVEGTVDGSRPAVPTASLDEQATAPWSPPQLESYDDLEDLLLLDPVHDVTQQGWPHAASE